MKTVLPIPFKVVLANIRNDVEDVMTFPLKEGQGRIFICPLCGFDKFTSSPYNRVTISGSDLDIQMFCFRCVWRGRRSELEIIVRDGPNYD